MAPRKGTASAKGTLDQPLVEKSYPDRYRGHGSKTRRPIESKQRPPNIRACFRLRVSWFFTLVSGSCNTQRNNHLKVADFHSPIPNWF